MLASWGLVCYAGRVKVICYSLAIVGSFLISNCAHVYAHARTHEPERPFVQAQAAAVARNVVLMIGDGMGAEHVWASWLSNKGALNITTLPVTGFSITTSASHTITDSAAGGTAIACGCKAVNGQLGMDAQGNHHESLAVQMRRAGKSTGLVVTKSITDATPAAFYAHTTNRYHTAEVAAALVDAGFDVIAGGGAGDFTEAQREQLQKRSLRCELAAPKECPPASVRGDWLPEQVAAALALLEKDKDGFFLMVEGSRIDTSAHKNDLAETVRETLDFDRAVGVVLKWMQQHPDTLLVVTADHQTGGLSLHGGSRERGEVDGRFSTFSHSGVAVPVYAAGAGAEQFCGVQQNTALAPKIRRAAAVAP